MQIPCSTTVLQVKWLVFTWTRAHLDAPLLFTCSAGNGPTLPQNARRFLDQTTSVASRFQSFTPISILTIITQSLKLHVTCYASFPLEDVAYPIGCPLIRLRACAVDIRCSVNPSPYLYRRHTLFR